MDADADTTMPTASAAMLQSGFNGTSKHASSKGKNEHGGRRHRSKSEGHDLHHTTNHLNDAIVGNAVKTAKEKNHDRKPRNLKGRGMPKKGKGIYSPRRVSF